MEAKPRFSAAAADTAPNDGSGACIRDLYRTATQAALCFVPGARADDAFMDALGALETALVSEAARRGVDIVPKLEGLKDPGQIQKEIRRVQKVERALLRACLSADGIGAGLRPMTRDRMMELAVARDTAQNAEGGVRREFCNTPVWLAWLDRMKKSGAAVDETLAHLIPPDEGKPRPVGAAFYKVAGNPDKQTDRLERLDAILEQNGIAPADLIIHPGVAIREYRRKTPYLLIDIPARDLQIAVCEKYGQMTFISRRVEPVSYWETHGKAALKKAPDIYPLQDDRHWTKNVAAHFDGTFLRRVQSVWSGPFIEEGRGMGRAVFTVDYLTRLISWYQEKEKADPYEESKTVWGKTGEGAWVRLEENWKHISNELRAGMRHGDVLEKSLAKFLDARNLRKYSKSPLTEKDLREMVALFQKMEGRDPHPGFEKKRKNPVWRMGADGEPYIDESKNWAAINFALKQGIGSVISPARSLAEFLDRNGLRKFSKPSPNGLFQREGRAQGETGAPPPPPAP